ncbi:MAG: NHL repeat-containing protein, partial [Chloroflexaceae bacterium]|nr:NHL repeat-containing protein [Chloroflexaceae bacterium]
ALTNGAAAEAVLGQADFTSATSATSQSGMARPFALALDGAGNLWVADTNNSRVLRFDNAATLPNGANASGVLGQPGFTSNTFATSQSGMSFPTGVAVDGAGRLWVADNANNRVLRFDNAATLPNGANASGVLGQANFTSRTAATSPNGMGFPNGVTVDGAGRVWVADSSNHRVLRFEGAAALPNGAAASGVLGQPDFTSATPATSQNGMRDPLGVLADGAGRLWVADSSNHRVLRFDGATTLPNGATAALLLGQPTFNGFVESTSQVGMFGPSALALDGAGRLWVADALNSRVLRFDKSPQTITFDSLANKALGDAPFALNATASSGLPVTFTSTTPAVCTVSGSTVTLVAVGTCIISASQAGDPDFSAVSVSQSFTVARTPQTITFGPLANKTLGDAPFALNATASSGLPVVFTSATPTVCTVSGSTVTLVAVGTCTINADQAGNANVAAAPQVRQSFTVGQAAPAVVNVYLPLVQR